MSEVAALESNLNLTEADAISRAGQGDALAFEFLYKKYSRHIFNLCLRMIKNRAEAEEVAQQVFLQLFRKIATFRGESAFSTWLHRVALNVVFMHFRQNKHSEVSIEDLAAQGNQDDRPRHIGGVDYSMFKAIDRLNLARAIRRLPSGYKRIFLLYDVLGLEHNEIAARLQCTVGTSKSQLHKARKQLRRLLLGDAV